MKDKNNNIESTRTAMTDLDNSKNHQLTKDDINKSYAKTMLEIQSHLSPLSKIFSKIIHVPLIDKISSLINNTILRPRPITYGAIGAISSIIIYLIAKKYGYILAGSETILLFIIGWTIGILIDYIRAGFFSDTK